MMPYSGEKAKCPKCGNDDIATNWIQARSQDVPPQPEHMRRSCLNCNYTWKEAPLHTEEELS